MSDVSLTIDGVEVTVPEGTTIWEAAARYGIEIPVLCHDPRLEPVGVCRICAVDVGERTLPAACVRHVEAGMNVITANTEITAHRRILTELMLSDQPEQSRREATTGDDSLYALARELKVSDFPWPDAKSSSNPPRGQDDSSPVIAVDHQACILCDRCVRACDDIQHNDVITRTGKGHSVRIGFDLDVPMAESSCVSCGECVAVCPTGALTHQFLGETS
ncbi:2Fe-2S iron-sulfur cluster-binding protein [Spiribacter salilacus]|uniref:2Fe-2S iron-sulfur cluster-binding protein n=1 Tax=Spiribacter salilacus TaxID=2664894 RepID=UPI001C12A94F|nr:2Fe-2S iron-sulfur cluster-binding protein [Spiribacter salilacus]